MFRMMLDDNDHDNNDYDYDHDNDVSYLEVVAIQRHVGFRFGSRTNQNGSDYNDYLRRVKRKRRRSTQSNKGLKVNSVE